MMFLINSNKIAIHEIESSRYDAYCIFFVFSLGKLDCVYKDVRWRQSATGEDVRYFHVWQDGGTLP